MLLKSKYIQPGVQVSILIKYHIVCTHVCMQSWVKAVCVCERERKAFFVSIVKYLFWIALL